MAQILVVDDEPQVRSMARHMLELDGHQVLEAADGGQALDSYRKHRPDLVVTDLLMPEQGGLVAIREIRDLDPTAPIVAISGGGRDGTMCFLSTARAFPGVITLKKPFRRRELLDAVHTALAGTPGAAPDPGAA